MRLGSLFPHVSGAHEPVTKHVPSAEADSEFTLRLPSIEMLG